MAYMRSDKFKSSRQLVGVSIVLALAVLAAGLVLAYKHAGHSDRDKSYDLYTIRAAVMDFYAGHNRLPEKLDQLGSILLRVPSKNYELQLEYKEYLEPDEHGIYVKKRKTDAFYYTLCTRFALPGPALHPHGFDDFTDHGIGRKCYRMDVFGQGTTSVKYSLGNYPEELKDYFRN